MCHYNIDHRACSFNGYSDGHILQFQWLPIGPQQPMEKKEGFYTPQNMGEINPKNEGNVGSHGYSLIFQ